MIHTNLSRPVIQTLGTTVMGYPVIIASVATLFCISGPAAILGKVAQLIIPSFYRRAFWSFAHVSKELRKTVWAFPAFADRNTNLPITWKANSARIGAALNHLRPRDVGGSSEISMSPIAVLGIDVSRYNLPSQVRDLLQQGCDLIRAAGLCRQSRSSIILT